MSPLAHVIESRVVQRLAGNSARTVRVLSWLLIFLGAFLSLLPSHAATSGTFTNPIISDGADPWTIYDGTNYYYTQTTGGQVKVRKSATLTGLGSASAVTVFTPPAPNNAEVWAPELHFLNGKWYIYFAADDGNNDNHRIYAAEANTSNPQGTYTLKGKVFDSANDFWAIDATVFQATNGALYMIWSGWPGTANVVQNLYIAPMSNPWTISGPRVLISTPTLNWETKPNTAAPLINEGPEVLMRNGKVFIVYSANKSWQDNYCLGLLSNTNGNYLNAASWTKYSQPVFFGIVDETGGLYAPGHCSFTRNAAQTEDWIVYHTAKVSGSGFDRNVHTQPFSWSADDFPFFGRPIVTNLPVVFPAGEGPSNPFTVNPNITNGFAQADIYSGIPGAHVSDLTNFVKFPGHADFSRYLGQLEIPRGTGNDYGARVSGYIIPPASGNYVFYVSSSQESQFFLSTNENPANEALICREPIGNSTYRNWTGTQNRPAHENVSTARSLVAGQSYYFEALVKAGVNGTNDYFGVAWETPGGSVPASGAAPIPGSALAFPFDSTLTTAPVIAQQPTNQTRYAGMSGTFNVVAVSTVTPAYQWQWQAATNDWQNLVGGYSPAISFPQVQPQNSATYRVVVRNQAGLTNSGKAALQVFPLPTISGKTQTGGSNYQVSFNAQSGVTFDLQATTNFSNWSVVATTNGRTGAVVLTDPQSSMIPYRAYRLNIR